MTILISFGQATNTFQPPHLNKSLADHGVLADVAEEALIVPCLSLKMLIQVMIYTICLLVFFVVMSQKENILSIRYIFAIYATCLGLKSNKLGAAQPSLAWEERRVIGMDFISRFQVQ